jgi:hypothetical protein
MARHVGFFSDMRTGHRAFAAARVLANCGMPKGIMMKTRTLTAAVLALPLLQGCTVLAIADVAASTVIYGVKTVVNVVDAVTPDIINRDKEKKKD